MSFWTVVGRLALAFGLAGLIGWEREHEEKPAGLRTFILVCLGSTLFVLVSLGIIEEVQSLADVGPTRVDPVRIIGSVAQGIGFLGGSTMVFLAGTGPDTVDRTEL